jgi:hypothetical protein
MNYWPVLPAMVIVAVLLWSYRKARERSRQINDLAQELGFRLLGEDLPLDIDLKSSSISNVSSVWNVIDGTPRGIRIVAFDCRIGQGKGSWETTVIAVNAEPGAVTASGFDLSLEKEHIDGWTLLFHRIGLEFNGGSKMSSEELKGYLEAI